MGDYYRGGGEGRGGGERRGGGRPPKRRYRGTFVKNSDVGAMDTNYLIKMMTIRANIGAHSVTSVRISSQNYAENSQPLRNRYVPSRLPDVKFDVILTQLDGISLWPALKMSSRTLRLRSPPTLRTRRLGVDS